ncbi:MAG TPA: hypothetical protein VKQ08_10265, partial [Cyclobacteriaceae bacterium]|nr:hypothetical protein [Cyclobacteriaceae bacterium]
IRHHKMMIASLIAENPEREEVIYSLFSPENLITFDEVWSAMEGFGNEYFIDLYKRRLNSDRRPQLKKYFRYVLGRLYLAEGKEKQAADYFEQVIFDPGRGDSFQTLLMARAYEGLARISDGAKEKAYLQQLYKIYPQLVPFTDLTMSFRLDTPPADEAAEQIINDLKKTRIAFTQDESAPAVRLTFTTHGEAIDIHYAIQFSKKITEGTLRIEKDERADAGKLLAYRFFGIQKTKIGEQPPASVQPVKDPKEKPV